MAATVKVFWWRWKPPQRLNFGDEITAPLVERITGRTVKWAAPDRCDLIGAGSVMQMLIKRRGDNDPLAWGSGFIDDPHLRGDLPTVRASAVRGERTLSNIESSVGSGVSLGDPGLLAPLFLHGAVKKRYALGVIPHYKDAESEFVTSARGIGSSVRVIDVGWTPEEVAREIASCDAVISSSLHGLIFSDALGVPNAHVRLGGKVKGGLYKFGDYYSAFSGADRYREYVPSADGLGSLQAVVDSIGGNYVAPRGLSDLQEGLVRSLGEL
ncbi:polysaccharide pyruvyl transferase family protein [Brachybacterium tyrofermentans]|uniref:Polysaccharide pyruvyl transferase family protein n=1 Tax=Brachybacterium tyrofermentans TaxID=47848 RepID=A0ABW0FGN0_9MICO